MRIPGWVPFIGNKLDRSQDLLVWTEDGKIIKFSVPIIRGYVVDEDRSGKKFGGVGSAFLLDQDALVREMGSTKSFLPVTEITSVPLYFKRPEKAKQKNIELTANLTAIAEGAFEEELSQVEKENAKDKLASTLMFLALLFGVFFIIMMIVMLAMSGKLKIPHIGG